MSNSALDLNRNERVPPNDSSESRTTNFVRTIIEEDLKKGTHVGKVATRFPPEPNGFLHIGHAKAICLNFGLARDYNGSCNLRFDDTNPAKEDISYVEAIQKDVNWLGFQWDHLRHASDYFGRLYEFAESLIKAGKAYVCELNEEAIREYRGTVTEPGKPSPYRDRHIEENLELFRRMRKGEFPDGAMVLRAKIDMASPNMKMRDPLLYRIRHMSHYRSGNEWCVYPMYDFAHCLSDAIEGITHSLCTLEFENNRELYDWILDETPGVPFRSRQYEFARLNLNYTVMSKRKFLRLVDEGYVSGWDDPRMPTIAGMRRRGYTPGSIRDFCERTGVAKANSVVDFAQLEFCVRNDLNKKAPRVLCVLKPLKVIIDNYPQDRTEMLNAAFFPRDVPRDGTREVPFSSVLYIDRDDFSEDPPKGWHRLAPGREVRLRHGYVIKCEKVVRDESGEITVLHCSYDPDTLGAAPKGRKVKGAIHWVSAAHALPAEVRLYDRLFTHERPDTAKDTDFTKFVNNRSLEIVSALIEPSVANDPSGSHYQFERLGFFFSDPDDSAKNRLVFNRTVPLRDSWSRTEQAEKGGSLTKSKKPPAQSEGDSPAETVARDPRASLDPVAQKRWDHYTKALDLSGEEAAVLADDEELTVFFENALAVHNNPKAVGGWVVNELRREIKDRPLSEIPIEPAGLASLVSLIDEGVISTKIAKDVFVQMVGKGGDPKTIVKDRGLEQVSDAGALEPVVARVLEENPEPVTRYRGGEKKLMGFFVGQVMKATKGKADPKLVNKIVRDKLEGGA